MKNIIHKLLNKVTPEFIRHIYTKPIFDLYNDMLAYSNNGYFSQNGEDIVLSKIFSNQENGFYVDVGAHHPRRFSNTFHFYNKGWRGINIDAMPGSMKPFKRVRPNDTNLEIAIAEIESNLTFYVFDEPAYNTFNKKEAQRKVDNNIHIKERIQLKTQRLEHILETHLTKNTTIDFLSIDAEGVDFEVLKSNNWIKYKPRVVLIELLGKRIENIIENPIYKYLKDRNYVLFSKVYDTLIFKLDNF